MLKTAKVVGLNSDNNAALAHIAQDFFAVATCHCDDAFSRTRQALFEAENVFSSSTQPLAQKLQEALTTIKEALADTQDLEVLVSAVTVDTSGIVLYLLGQGSLLSAYLIRDGKEKNLSELGRNQLVSGLLQSGDRVVIGTASLFELFNQDFSLIGKIPVDGFEDEISSRLPELKVNPIAAVVVENEVEVVKTEEIENLDTPSIDIVKPHLKIKVPSFFSNNFSKVIPRSKKGMAILGATLLLVVLIGTGFAYQQKKNSEAQGALNHTLDQAKEALNHAKESKDSDLPAALISLNQAQDLIDQVLKIKPQNQTAQDLKKQIDEARPEILKTYQVADFPLWLDLNLIKPGFTTSNLSLSHNKLLLLDQQKKTLVKVDLSSKAQQILAGSDKIGSASLASLNSTIAWVFSQDKGILKIDGEKADPTVAAKTDDGWGKIIDLYGFAGNVYLLDGGNPSTGSGQIWKYVPVEAGYSDKQPYFKEGSKVDLSAAKKMEIDSSIWVLKNDGGISKYTQGVADYFSLSGLDKGVKDPKSFFVSSETDNLYILDSGNNRVLVLDKKGVYKVQYQSDKFGSFSDLVVDEKGKKVYLLDGSKIVVIDLKL